MSKDSSNQPKNAWFIFGLLLVLLVFIVLLIVEAIKTVPVLRFILLGLLLIAVAVVFVTVKRYDKDPK